MGFANDLMKDTNPSRRRALAGGFALLLALAPALQAQQQNPGNPAAGGAAGQDPQQFDLQIEGDRISLTVDENTGISLTDFVKLAERVTRRVFIYSPTEFTQAQVQNISFVGTITETRDNYFNFFQTMLYIKGFACVIRPTGNGEIVEIVQIAGPKRGEIQSSAQYVPPSEVETYATQTGVTILTSIPLEHINGNTAQTQLRPFFAQAGAAQSNVVLGSVGDGGSLLMQGYGPQVYAAYQMLKLVDIPPEVEEPMTRVERLTHSTAEELEPILKQVMDERNRRVAQATGVSGGDLAAGQRGQVTVIGLPSLNGMLLHGPEQQVREALDLIARLDVPLEVGTGEIHVIQLKNVLAEDLTTVLRNFINEDLQADRQAAQGGGATAGQSSPREMRRTVVVAHPESNSILVSATQSKFQQLEAMIRNLDSRQPQVLIEAAIVELTTTDLQRLGVELGLLDITDGSDFTRPFGFTSFGLSSFSDTDDDGLPDTRLPDFENPLQGLTGGIISNDDFAIPILVNALETDSTANILSLPSVVVNNNEEASIRTQEDRPTQTTQQGNATTQAGFAGFEGAGIELNISPSISSNEYLRLNLRLNVSRFLTPFDPASVTPGVKATREVSTAVTMPSGHTMVLGGVIEDTTSESASGIPFLKDIPLLGLLFQTKTSDENKTNLYFFVTPTILDEDDFSDLAAASFRKKLEAAKYIGNRRLQIVDRRWREGRAETLEDTGATIEDLDMRGGFEMPSYRRPSGPDLPANGTPPVQGGGEEQR